MNFVNFVDMREGQPARYSDLSTHLIGRDTQQIRHPSCKEVWDREVGKNTTSIYWRGSKLVTTADPDVSTWSDELQLYRNGTATLNSFSRDGPGGRFECGLSCHSKLKGSWQPAGSNSDAGITLRLERSAEQPMMISFFLRAVDISIAGHRLQPTWLVLQPTQQHKATQLQNFVLRVELAEKRQELAAKKKELAKISPLFQLDHLNAQCGGGWRSLMHASTDVKLSPPKSSKLGAAAPPKPLTLGRQPALPERKLHYGPRRETEEEEFARLMSEVTLEDVRNINVGQTLSYPEYDQDRSSRAAHLARMHSDRELDDTPPSDKDLGRGVWPVEVLEAMNIALDENQKAAERLLELHRLEEAEVGAASASLVYFQKSIEKSYDQPSSSLENLGLDQTRFLGQTGELHAISTPVRRVPLAQTTTNTSTADLSWSFQAWRSGMIRSGSVPAPTRRIPIAETTTNARIVRVVHAAPREEAAPPIQRRPRQL